MKQTKTVYELKYRNTHPQLLAILFGTFLAILYIRNNKTDIAILILSVVIGLGGFYYIKKLTKKSNVYHTKLEGKIITKNEYDKNVKSK